MKTFLILGIIFIMYMFSIILPYKTSLHVHNSLYLPRMDERTLVRHAGGLKGYPVITHSRVFTINNKSHNIPNYNTVYDCKEHKVKFLTGSYQNIWQPISDNSDEEVIFEYACFTER